MKYFFVNIPTSPAKEARIINISIAIGDVSPVAISEALSAVPLLPLLFESGVSEPLLPGFSGVIQVPL